MKLQPPTIINQKSLRFIIEYSQRDDHQVGIVGFGTIGRGVAQRALGFQMRVVAVDGHRGGVAGAGGRCRCGWAWEDAVVGTDDQLPRLLSESDFVVIAVPLLPQTRGMIGVKARRRGGRGGRTWVAVVELSLMKSDAVLINIARGPIVDEVPFWTALQGEKIGGAVLDVWWNDFSWFQNGTWPSTFNFSSLPNVWMTPHVSVNTLEAHKETLDQAADNFLALAAGKPLRNVVRNASSGNAFHPAVLVA
eukprot:Skav209888  [mRNA]  locus=scaffold2642:256352:262599:- [translate_table: standard]